MKNLDEIDGEFQALKTAKTIAQYDQDQLILLGAILGLSWVLERTKESQPALSTLMAQKNLAITEGDHVKVRAIHMKIIEEVLHESND